jgi:hypothetical protein
MTADGVHFVTWTDPDAVTEWDPDREPGRFVSGIGHHLLEPYARLRDRGWPVSVGLHPPRGTRTLAVSMNDLVSWEGYRRRRAAWTIDLLALRVPRVVLVLGDHPLAARVPTFVRAVIVPNPSGAVDARTRWVPLPPQRGMVPRSPDRFGTVRSLALKTGTANVPDEVRDPEFVEALARLGVTFRLDERSPLWPDFSDVDLVLCTRRPRPGLDADDTARKPPTKLINAWVAGCVPLVAPERGFLDLVTPGEDAIVIDSPDDVIAAVGKLRDDPALLARLERGVAARGAEFAPDRVMAAWERELWGGDHAVTSRWAVAGDAGRLVAAAVAGRFRRTGVR